MKPDYNNIFNYTLIVIGVLLTAVFFGMVVYSILRNNNLL